jgi:prepilin-type N-terminal cleavage/methylation domain-containing protein
MVSRLRDARGFSLVELLVASVISLVVLGGALTMSNASQVSQSSQLKDTAADQELRYALEWIGSIVQSAGTNPYGIVLSACPAANTPFQAIRMDPNGDGVNDDIRVQADVNPTNRVLGGLAAACNEAGEDVLIAHNAANSVITRRDMSIDATPVEMTDRVVTNLTFTYRDVSRNVTVVPGNVVFVTATVTVRSSGTSARTNQRQVLTASREIRLRAR